MWWDMIPSGAVMTACFILPSIFTYGFHVVFLGNPYKRIVATKRDTYHYLRDQRLSKNEDPYEQFGLENLDSGN